MELYPFPNVPLTPDMPDAAIMRAVLGAAKYKLATTDAEGSEKLRAICYAIGAAVRSYAYDSPQRRAADRVAAAISKSLGEHGYYTGWLPVFDHILDKDRVQASRHAWVNDMIAKLTPKEA